jgi:hypothetical protein
MGERDRTIMALIQTLLTRNECDLALQNIRFHLESGVDHVVLTDHLSTDGLRDHLTPFVKQGALTYIRQESIGFDQSKWVTHMANVARNDLGARWVIHTDSDEFWVTTNAKSLKSAFRRRPFTNVLTAKRHNFICPDNNSNPFWENMIYRRTQSYNSMGNPLPGKIAHKSAANLTIDAGNHDVTGFRKKRTRANLLEVLHFPLRTKTQFTKKIAQGGKALSLSPHIPMGIGMTWRRHFTELSNTGGITFIDENILSTEQINKGLSDGSLIIDTRLRDQMRLLNAA